MIAFLELEWRNHNTSQLMRLCRGIINEAVPGAGAQVIGTGDPYRPWVARITGKDSRFGMRREFVRPMKDYSRSNGKESRGVYSVFTLRDGYYEVRDSRGNRSFVRSSGGEITDTNRSEVEAWIAASEKSG